MNREKIFVWNANLSLVAATIINPWNAAKKIRSSYAKKYCVAPKAGPSSCRGMIVKAHSVQEALLRKIALL
jgi:hypothetical protein